MAAPDAADGESPATRTDDAARAGNMPGAEGGAMRALQFDAHDPEQWIAWSLRGLLLALGVAVWFQGWSLFTAGSLAFVAIGGLVGAVVIGALPADGVRRMRVIESAWSAVFVAHLLGHVFGLYDNWPLYDKVLHATGGIAASVIAYQLGRATGWFWGRDRPNRFIVFYTTFAAAVIGGVLTEVLEYAGGVFFGAQSQTHPWLSRIDDTMTDLVAETVTGAATALYLAWRVGRPLDEARETRSRARRERSA